MRRTKEEALATRSGILDAAERLFAARGVSRTSLHDIAAAAGVTRGAVYWHFAGKADLFEAMLDRVTLPLETPQGNPEAAPLVPLDAVRARFMAGLTATARDARTRRVFDIALHKAEYTGELRTLRRRRRRARAAWLSEMEGALRRAQRAGLIGRATRARHTALALLALVEGLISHWLLEPRSFDLVATGTQALDAYLRGLSPQEGMLPSRAARRPAPAPRRVSAARRSRRARTRSPTPLRHRPSPARRRIRRARVGARRHSDTSAAGCRGRRARRLPPAHSARRPR